MRWLASLMLLWLCSCAPQEGVLLRVNLTVATTESLVQLEVFIGKFQPNVTNDFAPNQPVFVRDASPPTSNQFDIASFADKKRFDLLLPDDQIPVFPEWREVLVVASAHDGNGKLHAVAWGSVKANSTSGRVNIYDVDLKPIVAADFESNNGCTRWGAGVIIDAGVTACPSPGCIKTGLADTCDGIDDDCNGESPNLQIQPQPLRCLRSDTAMACGLSTNPVCDDYQHTGRDFFVCDAPAAADATCLDNEHCKDFVALDNRYKSQSELTRAYENLFKKADYTCEIPTGANDVPCGIDASLGVRLKLSLPIVSGMSTCPTSVQGIYVDQLLYHDGDWQLAAIGLTPAVGCNGVFSLQAPAMAVLPDPKHMLVGVSRPGLPNIGLVVELKKKATECSTTQPTPIVICTGQLPASCAP